MPKAGDDRQTLHDNHPKQNLPCIYHSINRLQLLYRVKSHWTCTFVEQSNARSEYPYFSRSFYCFRASNPGTVLDGTSVIILLFRKNVVRTIIHQNNKMFQVHRYDPRKEDPAISTAAKKEKNHQARKSKQRQRDVDNHDKKNNSIHQERNDNDNQRLASKKRQRKEELDDNDNHPDPDDSHQTMTDSSVGPSHLSQNNKNNTTIHNFNGVSKMRYLIAPKTDGALSSEKNLSNPLTAEAFDDLDLPDDIVMGGTPQDQHQEDEKEEVEEKEDSGGGSSDTVPKNFDPTDEIQRALYMTTLPIIQAARRWGLADFLVQNLQRDGYINFFPIQALVIPDVIIAEGHMGTLQTRDVCCAAPTGSGKTLAFVLPLLNTLAHRTVRRLRALVILPSRDLAQQVHAVFQRYSEGSHLKIGLAIGQTDFQAEQKALILGDDNKHDKHDFQYPCLTHLRHIMNPGNLEFELDAMANDLGFFLPMPGQNSSDSRKTIPAGGLGAVDVLVCTPGRLVDHLDNTPGFTLQHLRFLVIDEADRLLSQSYHGWIHRVLDNVHAVPKVIPTSTSIEPVTYRRSTVEETISSSTNSVVQRIQLRKMLFSATLTKDPKKLASLKLTNPKYFNAHHLNRATGGGEHNKNNVEGSLYRVPDRLEENIVECTAEQKPLVLLALLLDSLDQSEKEGANRMKQLTVVFTSSLESTHRLTRLLQLLWQAAEFNSQPPVEFSSTLTQTQRSRLIEQCNDPSDESVSVLVCSDGMSRGMDLSCVRLVIHYDLPSMSKTYVHRCGRTARAGESGQAIALLKGKGQLGQFRRLRQLIANPERVTKTTVKTSLVRGVIPQYKRCISCLKEVLAAENRLELNPLDVVNLSKWLNPSFGDNNNNDESSVSDDSNFICNEDGTGMRR
jgi:ATP-dependent RNA helicase DDX51/DBP6